MNLFRYSFENLPFKDVVAISRDHLSKIALLDVDPFEGDRLHSIGMDVRLLPGLTAGKLWCSPGRATRTAAHVADGNDNVVLVMPVDTDMVISRAGHGEIVCRAGEVFVWASDEPVSFAYRADCTTFNLSLPRAALSAQVPRLGEWLMRTVGVWAARDSWLLRGYTSLVVGGEPLLPETEHLAVAHLYDLAGLLLAPQRDPGAARASGVRTARLWAIKADVTANITRPLSAEEVALRHGISPRHLRALFAEEGTSYTDFVLEQRLARAARMLADLRFAGRTVADIAYGCGFNDVSYFNRVFRRRYGMSPSEVRAAEPDG